MISIRNKALQLLGRRDHSYAELGNKLAYHYPEVEPSKIIELLDDFVALGWLSDQRFAEQWVYFRSQRYGQMRLRQELKEKGVADDIIFEALSAVEDIEELTALTVLRKKFTNPPQSNMERAKQLRHLASRGFSISVIYQVVDHSDEYDR